MDNGLDPQRWETLTKEKWVSMETANVVDAHELYMKRVEALRKSDAEIGWYQDGAGGLYHFDGKVWDVVPEEMTKRLEYLG